MKVLQRRPIGEASELAGVVAACLGHLEPGLRTVERAAHAEEVPVDLAGVDGAGRLTLVCCEPVAGPDLLLRAVEAQAWWREHGAIVPRVFGDRVDPQATPRALAVAGRWSDRALRLLAALGPVAPMAVECRVFVDAEGGPLVSLERVEGTRAPAGGEGPRDAALVERLRRGAGGP
jgi:hypothetical protein